MSISKNLVLFKYLIGQFGFDKFEDLQGKFYDVELYAETAETSPFFQMLADKVRFDVAKLKDYDENIIRHLETINRHRNPKFNLKYYQYFSLLFTEYYLDHYLEDELEFAESLQAFATRIYTDENNTDEELKTYDKDKLNLIAYWMATGSGKTLILHFNVLQYKFYAKKHSRKTKNLKDLCKESFCSITLENDLQINSLTDIENLQKITISVLKKYLVSYYNNFQRVYEAKNMQSVILTQEHPVLQKLDYSLKIEKTDGNGKKHPNINDLIEEIEDFVEETKGNIEKYKDSKILKNVWFEQHLFQPLLISSKEQETRFHIEAISPQGINEGEANFVSDFSSHIASSKAEGKYADCDFYLLRNGTRSNGFGFYFSSAGGFFPDFLLWIKQIKDGKEKQYLSFVDPHGLRNEQDGSNSDKIKLAERFKDQKKEFPEIEDIMLNSFILSPSTLPRSKYKFLGKKVCRTCYRARTS